MGSGVRFGGDGFVEVLAATQTPTDKEWFQGTADAVRQYAWLFEDIKNRVVEDIIILSGDHLYAFSAPVQRRPMQACPSLSCQTPKDMGIKY